MQRWITYYGRETVARNVKRDPKRPRWARVPSGSKTCALCELLASRGFVYHSKETAGALKQWHSHCDCMIVPSWDKELAHIAGYDPDAYYQRYQQAYKLAQADKDVSANNVTHYMRKLFPGQYTDNTSTKKSTTSRGKPRKTRAAWVDESKFVGMRGLESIPQEQWDKRQEALGIPTNVDILEMHEIVFMEKFKQLGQHYQWIPKDAIGMTPTNDFYWVEQSTLIELKSVRKVRYAKIASEIRQAVVRAATNEYKPMIKDSFIVDLGEVRLTEKLTHQLEEYNIRSTQGNIKRLWVYSQGEIIEIALKKK